MSELKKGTTSRTEYFRMITTSGTPLLTAIVGSLTMAYVRDRSSIVSSIPAAATSEGAAYAAYKALEVVSGGALGLYRADYPDAAFVTGVDKVILALTHPLADPALKEYALVDNIESDSFTVVTSNATALGSAQTGINSLYARLGAPVGASASVDVASIQTMITSIYARIGAPTGATLTTDVASVQAGVTANANAVSSLHTRVSSVDTRVSSAATQVGSTFTGVGSLAVGVNVDRVSSDANAATNLYRGVLGTALFTVGGGSTVGIMSLSALTTAAAAAQQFKGRIVTFDRDTTTAELRGQATDILSSSVLGLLGVTSLTNAPVSGDKGVIT